jgi:hypothetical protein
MFLRMPVAILLGALLGWIAAGYIPAHSRAMFNLAALVLASLIMPFWMLPVMMDKAEALLQFRIGRDISLAFSGAATVICFSTWAPVLRHLWVLEQVGMLTRYAVWYGFAPVALCTAWDAGTQEKVGQGLVAASLLLGGTYLAQYVRTRGARAQG